MAIFSFAVKYNGKYYPPHTLIEEKPVEAPAEKGEETKPKKSKVKKDA